MNTQTHTFKIHVGRIDQLLHSIEKVNRRAKKLNCPAAVVTVGDEVELVKVFDGHGRPTGEKYAVKQVTVTCSPVVIEGWRFVAALEDLDGEVFVRAAPGATVPAKFRDHSRVTDCDHCCKARSRSVTYVLAKEEVHKQVGSSCLIDFVGHKDALSLAGQAEILTDVIALCDAEEEGYSMGGPITHLDMDNFLAYSAWAIRRDGWISRSSV